jgi:CHAT domain-containing protein
MRWRLILAGLWLAAGAALAAGGFESKLAEGEAYLRQDHYRMAQDALEEAARLAETPAQRARAEGLLGLAYHAARRGQAAEAHLAKAVESGEGAPRERARWLAALADLKADLGEAQAALGLYSEALALVADDPALAASIRLGRAERLPPERRLAELGEIRNALDGIADPGDRARRLVNLGAQAGKLGSGGEGLAQAALGQALILAQGNARLRAEALDSLAGLDEAQGRPEAALARNAGAEAAARSIDARDLLMVLEWRAGRLSQALGRKAEALAAYRLAVADLEAIRDDIPVEYHDGRSSFRETLEPLYLGLSGLLLEEADKRGGDARTALLREARDTVELIKRSEIEDFLGGRCALDGAKSTPLEAVGPGTAVLYPVILPDRLVLLAAIGGELRQYSQAVPAKEVEATARALASALRNASPGTEALARTLYQWLVAPAEPWLRERQVKTLVAVPDGALRLVPWAALHDGGRYLVERYAVATSPGLSLLEASPLRQQGMRALLAGMSQPGPVVDRLPPAFLRELVGGGRGLTGTAAPASRALRAMPVGAVPGGGDPDRLLRDADFRRQLLEQLRLPGVDREISSLSREVPGKALMNEAFGAEAFKAEAVAGPYTVVHIASHGVFGQSAAASFIMAYDDVIDIDGLERLFKSPKFSRQPVELLTLSACQTAEGDDRAPLGLSGIALKAKVRSALGSLWPVSDDAAAELMVGLYRNLGQGGASKAEALREAQLALLRSPRFAHPFFWAPFVLVGNWL